MLHVLIVSDEIERFNVRCVAGTRLVRKFAYFVYAITKP